MRNFGPGNEGGVRRSRIRGRLSSGFGRPRGARRGRSGQRVRGPRNPRHTCQPRRRRSTIDGDPETLIWRAQMNSGRGTGSGRGDSLGGAGVSRLLRCFRRKPCHDSCGRASGRTPGGQRGRGRAAPRRPLLVRQEQFDIARDQPGTAIGTIGRKTDPVPGLSLDFLVREYGHAKDERPGPGGTHRDHPFSGIEPHLASFSEIT